MKMMNTILEIKDLKKNYRNFSLNSISFDVKEGEIVGFIGPNGSGKSTTMQILMGIREKDGGTIRFDGKEVFEDKPEYKQKIGYVGESLDFYEKVKLRKIYQFVRSLYSDWNDELFHELIRTFDLSLDKKNRENSKGMKVKFCLALALATNPKLLILDEPTSGLDPIIRIEVLNILESLSTQKNTAILFSSHITEDLEKLADRFVFIYRGKLIRELTREAVIKLNKPLDILLKQFMDEEDNADGTDKTFDFERFVV